jgi:Plasma-membrane choline transporter
MVPFAAVNLKVATKGVTQNCGLFFVAFLFMKLGVTWVVFWAYTAVGVAWSYTGSCEDGLHPNSTRADAMKAMQYDDDACDPPLLSVLFFLLSLYWTVTITMVSAFHSRLICPVCWFL